MLERDRDPGTPVSIGLLVVRYPFPKQSLRSLNGILVYWLKASMNVLFIQYMSPGDDEYEPSSINIVLYSRLVRIAREAPDSVSVEEQKPPKPQTHLWWWNVQQSFPFFILSRRDLCQTTDCLSPISRHIFDMQGEGEVLIKKHFNLPSSSWRYIWAVIKTDIQFPPLVAVHGNMASTFSEQTLRPFVFIHSTSIHFSVVAIITEGKLLPKRILYTPFGIPSWHTALGFVSRRWS